MRQKSERSDFLFILTDGKNYVMENPMKSGEYMITTSSSMAKEFIRLLPRIHINKIIFLNP